MSIGLTDLVLGGTAGLTYGVLAIGLALIYKSGRFVNFAHGNLGVVCAVLFGKAVVDWGVPYWVALPGALALGGALGGLLELGIVRRLFDAPRLVLVVATIGVSQILLYLSLQRFMNADQNALRETGYPVPFDAEWVVGGVVLRGGEIGILVLTPIVTIAIAAFFRYTSYGQAIRAAAENPDAARLAGISVRRMSTLVWVIAGVLAAFTLILVSTQRPVFQVGALGPGILVRALGAALVGRMTNLPVVFGAALGIGVLERVVLANFDSGGLGDLFLFVVIMGALAFQGREIAKSTRDGQSDVTFGAELRTLPSRVLALPAVRRMHRLATWGALGFAVLLPQLPILGFDTQGKAFLFTLTLGYVLVGLSMTLLVGWAGQVSLGQFALVGVGSFTAARIGDGMPLPLLVIVVGLVGAAVAVAVGLPAVRIQGLFLAVSTLAFAVVAKSWIFQQPTLAGTDSTASMVRPDLLARFDLGATVVERDIYYFALVLVVLATIAVRNIRGSAIGRSFIAVRDNDKAARSDGLSAAGTRLLSFALSGFIAAVAGLVFALARVNFDARDYDPAVSLSMLLMVIIGGLGSIPGAILGAAFLYGLPALFDTSDLVQLLTSGIGVLIVLLFLPGGLMELVHRARAPFVERAVRRAEGRPAPPSIVPPWRDVVTVARGRRPEPTSVGSAP
jgi:ABC-type branched-subunit amino acid transport system permease subunit